MTNVSLNIPAPQSDLEKAGAKMAAFVGAFEDRFWCCGGDAEALGTAMIEFLCGIGSLEQNAAVRPLLESAGLITSVGTYLRAIETILQSSRTLVVSRKPVRRETASPQWVRPTLSKLVGFQKQMESLEAVPAIRAASLLGVDRKTIYRWIDLGKLEMIRRKGKAWISVRSIEARMNERYAGTQEFDVRGDDEK
jgi:hypothetical protein